MATATRRPPRAPTGRRARTVRTLAKNGTEAVKTIPGRRPGRAGSTHPYLVRAARIALGAFVVAAGTLAFPHGPAVAVVSPLARVALLVLFCAAFALYLRY